MELGNQIKHYRNKERNSPGQKSGGVLLVVIM